MTVLKSIVITAIAAASVVTFSTTSFAADSMVGTGGYATQMRNMETMKMIDANGDHMVSQDEFTKYYTDLFNMLDKDHDGSVDMNEWKGMQKNAEAMIGTGGYATQFAKMDTMKMMDKMGDHKITKQAFLDFHQQFFDSAKKKDDMITSQEWARMLLSK
jgi:hypothetical protein